jgi:site-specific DNA recombinase
MNEPTLRVAIYARVSSEQQAKTGTIESQIAELVERVSADGLALEDEARYLDDGYSGSTLIRPALERLRDAAYAGAMDRLYVQSPDRLARKYAWQVLLLDELKRAGVEVVFLHQRRGESPEDELMLQMQGMIAEYERAKILERSRRGKRHAARRGSVNVLGAAPYGYRYVCKQDGGGEARYEVVEEEARIVRQVFEAVAMEGLSLGVIRRRLHEQGVKTSTGKEWWDRSTLRGMLKNPAYYGAAAFGKTRHGPRRVRLRTRRGQIEPPRREASVYDTTPQQQEHIPVPALISRELFETVAQQHEENKRRKRERERGTSYLLQGLLQCACCGYSFYAKAVYRASSRRVKERRNYVYYRCGGTDASRFPQGRPCHNRQVRSDLLEEAVWQDVCALLRDPQHVRREYERRLADGPHDSLRLSQLTTGLHKVRRAMTRLIDAYQEGLLPKEEFEPRMRSQQQRLARLQEEHRAAQAAATQQDELRLIIAHFDDFAQRVSQGLDSLTFDDQRDVIRALVKRVEIGEDDVRIIYRVSPPPFVQGPASGANHKQHCLWRVCAP